MKVTKEGNVYRKVGWLKEHKTDLLIGFSLVAELALFALIVLWR